MTGLEAPVPIHKVDPKYPQNMINANVQGEVLLYAIIRTDGSVDSVQLVRGIEPELDHNAMLALAQWKFQPATRNNHRSGTGNAGANSLPLQPALICERRGLTLYTDRTEIRRRMSFAVL